MEDEVKDRAHVVAIGVDKATAVVISSSKEIHAGPGKEMSPLSISKLQVSFSSLPISSRQTIHHSTLIHSIRTTYSRCNFSSSNTFPTLHSLATGSLANVVLGTH